MKKTICLVLITLLSISSFAQEIPFKIQKSEVFKDEFKESQIVLSEEDGNGGILIIRSYKGNGISPNAGYYFEHYDGNLKLIKEYDFQIKHPISQKTPIVLGIFRLENRIQIIEMFYDINEKSYICMANSIRANDFILEKKELFYLFISGKLVATIEKEEVAIDLFERIGLGLDAKFVIMKKTSD